MTMLMGSEVCGTIIIKRVGLGCCGDWVAAKRRLLFFCPTQNALVVGEKAWRWNSGAAGTRSMSAHRSTGALLTTTTTNTHKQEGDRERPQPGPVGVET